MEIFGMPVSASALFIAHWLTCLAACLLARKHSLQNFRIIRNVFPVWPFVHIESKGERDAHFVEMKIEPEKMQYENNNKLQTCDAFHTHAHAHTQQRLQFTRCRSK